MSAEETVELIVVLVVWLLGVGGAFAFGVYAIRHPRRVAAFFHRFGARTFGREAADQIYTPYGARVAGIAFVIVTPPMAAVGIWALLRTIVGAG